MPHGFMIWMKWLFELKMSQTLLGQLFAGMRMSPFSVKLYPCTYRLGLKAPSHPSNCDQCESHQSAQTS